MAVTATKALTVGGILNASNLNLLADALAQVQLGTVLALQKETISQTAADTITLSKAAFGPAMVHVRVTAGGASTLGKYVVSDSGGVAVLVGSEIGVCLLSDDGLTLTFATGSAITAAEISYMAAPAVALDSLVAY